MFLKSAILNDGKKFISMSGNRFAYFFKLITVRQIDSAANKKFTGFNL
jgi:hypothetical protein